MSQSLALHQFEQKLQVALDRVRQVLAANKAPKLAADVHHQYDDKYSLVESVTNAAAASQLNCLAVLGLTAEQLRQLQDWGKTSSVSFQFRAEERCRFLREETRERESPTKRVDEVSMGGLVQAAFTSKVVTTITEYFWNFEVSYELTAIRGVGATDGDRLLILSRKGHSELKTSTKSPPPHPEAKVPAMAAELPISWLLKLFEQGSTSPSFKIDRKVTMCKTPRRNPDVDSAFTHFTKLTAWLDKVATYVSQVLTSQPSEVRKFDLAALDPAAILVPVLPVMVTESDGEVEGEAAEAAAGTLARLSREVSQPAGGLIPGVLDLNRLLSEEIRALKEKHSALAQSFPSGDGVATAKEAILIVTFRHLAEVARRWGDALEYVENLLRQQLAAAIGKEVSPADFAAYMKFHYRKLFKDSFAPSPFCFAVRRSDRHGPEGTVSIEEECVGTGGDSNIQAPIVTMAAQSSSSHAMNFELNASTTVSFGGERYLHAWLSHQFSGQTGAKLSLVSRARQFSSMIVLVGRVTLATSFQPSYAAIVQNKDELTIPLDLSTIPTPKEFKDAIESLSPEQQAFAKAFRAMQLESTLFGILVVQIKPQLEKVLNLADDSLTKEIKLTQDLMQLFIKYQIPSDLLSFDAGASPEGTELVAPTAAERLEAVKGHVKSMQEMIRESQDEEITQRRQEVSYDDPWSSASAWQSSSMPAPPMAAMAAADMMMSFGAAPAPMAACSSAGGGGSTARSCAFGSAESAPRSCKGGSKSNGAAPPPPPLAPTSSQGAPAPSTGPSPGVPQWSQQQPDSSGLDSSGSFRDYTQVPRQMDESFERLDTDSALRPTIITPAPNWTKKAQKALLATPTTFSLGSDEQKSEKDAAFDLLDALTKSGALELSHASLHIVVAATHCFDKTVTESVIQDNMNPIEKVERSSLIMASTVHQQPVAALINEAQRQRVNASSPMLFIEDQA